jgi:hypothetical protein
VAASAGGEIACAALANKGPIHDRGWGSGALRGEYSASECVDDKVTSLRAAPFLTHARDALISYF